MDKLKVVAAAMILFGVVFGSFSVGFFMGFEGSGFFDSICSADYSLLATKYNKLYKICFNIDDNIYHMDPSKFKTGYTGSELTFDFNCLTK